MTVDEALAVLRRLRDTRTQAGDSLRLNAREEEAVDVIEAAFAAPAGAPSRRWVEES